MADSTPLFIVDNTPDGRSGLDYLRQWCDIARSFDVATGFFDIGALRALDGEWQKLEGIRILMGDEMGSSTKKALLQAVTERARRRLDESLESEKRDDPFLAGVDGIVDAIADGRIQAKVYAKKKFHAKAYITHPKLEVVGSQALVGSSNFTRAGLTQNVELNIRLESTSEVSQLQAWYERHWDEADDITADLLKVIQRHVVEHEPFEVYARALQALVSTYDPSELEWDRSTSLMWKKLDRYQQEGYAALVGIAEQHGGALLCDGVGLGKTFVGLQLIERLVLKEGKRVVLLAPKAVREAVWDVELRNHLGHIGGFEEAADFSNLAVFNHTDLNRAGFVERFERIAAQAHAIVIDEAHHFRNRGPTNEGLDLENWSRYHRLRRLISNGRDKRVYLLTATPINNSLNDFRHLLELFAGDDDAYFARTLGVNSLSYRINALTKQVNEGLDGDAVLSDDPELVQEKVSGDPLFSELVVQRSRSYAKESQVLEGKTATHFPDRGEPQVEPYSLRASHGRLLDLLDEAFERDTPLFSLAIYYPLAYWIGGGDEIDPKAENRQKQVVGLIRTNFLKRFESSVYAFERSCDRLMRRLLAFLKRQEAGRRAYERWVAQHAELLDVVTHRQLELLGEQINEEDETSEDVVSPELLDSFEELDPEHYDVGAIVQECLLDLDLIGRLLEESRAITATSDDKLRALTERVAAEQAAGRKVLVFTEFADTARYLARQLQQAGIADIDELDGSRGVDRRGVIQRFAPYYNGSTSGELLEESREEISVLITTDVLAEGRHTAGQLRHPLEPRPSHATHRASRPPTRRRGGVGDRCRPSRACRRAGARADPQLPSA